VDSVSGRDVVTWRISRILAGFTDYVRLAVQAPTTPTALSMTATITAETPDPEMTNNRASEETTVVAPAPDLLVGAFGPESVAFGDTFSYTLAVGNLGQRPATNVVLTDLLPEGVQFISADAGGHGLSSESGGTVRFDLATIRPGDFVTVSIQVRAISGGIWTNVETVRGAEEDANLDNNSATVQTTITVPPLSTVGRVVLNDGHAQRSMINSITVTISGLVTFAPGSFELLGPSNGRVSLNIATSVLDRRRTLVVLTFTRPGIIGCSLAAGQYKLLIHSDRIHDAFGRTLDGDGDGRDGGDRIDKFFRLFGDSDGDGDVDDVDRDLFRSSFKKSAGDPGFLWFFDFHGDGQVGGRDNGQFNRRRTH